MLFFQKELSNLTHTFKNISSSKIKKKIVTAFTFISLSAGLAHAALANENTKITTVYYVYLNDTYMGTVTDKNVVKEVIAEKQGKLDLPLRNFDSSVAAQIQFVPQQVVLPSANNQDVIENLEKALKLQRNAAAIDIDGKPAVYVANKADAESVLNKLTLQYVSEDQLKDWKARKSAPVIQSLPPVKENETRLLDVHLSKPVTVTEEKVSPTKILSIDQALTYLQKGTIEDRTYKVKDGDVLESIAHDHQFTIAELLKINPGLTEESVLKPDQELHITVAVPLLQVIVEKEAAQKEVIPFKDEIIDNPSLLKGEKRVRQVGQEGSSLVTYAISEQNGEIITKQIQKNEILIPSVTHVVVEGTKVIPSRGEGTFAWPTDGGYISSGMGYRNGKFHKGVDIARPSDYTIKAADNGVIVFAGWDNGGYGNKIVIDHQNGFQTIYGHLSSIAIHTGQVVSKGEAIGIMGSTGDSTGVHLHFEVHHNGTLKNPLEYLSK